MTWPGRPDPPLAADRALRSSPALALAAIASKRMVSTKLGPTPLRDDRRRQVRRRSPTSPASGSTAGCSPTSRWLEKRYKIFVTDGYSMDDVHAANGEHPIGLALDIVPNKRRRRHLDDIDRLAAWAEPEQNQPRAPFRWVGYNGDAGHGRGNHLHLSWSHSETKPGRTARTVYTSRCPSPPTTPPPSTEPDDPPGGGTDVDPTIPLPADDGSDTTSGGIGAKPKWKPAPPILETGGVAFSDR